MLTILQAKANKLLDDIETCKFISTGPQTSQTESNRFIATIYKLPCLEFYGLPEDQILKALQVLQQNGKAEVMEFYMLHMINLNTLLALLTLHQVFIYTIFDLSYKINYKLLVI